MMEEIKSSKVEAHEKTLLKYSNGVFVPRYFLVSAFWVYSCPMLLIFKGWNRY